jgi:hypothetical protein
MGSVLAATRGKGCSSGTVWVTKASGGYFWICDLSYSNLSAAYSPADFSFMSLFKYKVLLADDKVKTSQITAKSEAAARARVAELNKVKE